MNDRTKRARPGDNVISDSEIRCGKCKQVKHPDDFHRASKSSTGRQSSCKACARDYSREHSRKRWRKTAQSGTA